MLVSGQWSEDWHPVQKRDATGRFIRQRSGFRHHIGGHSPFAAEAGRYVLYVAYICPWASRALIALRLTGLEHVIEVCAVDPRLGDQGWAFTGETGSDLDHFYGARYLLQIYTQADATYTGRATVPVLWDSRHQRMPTWPSVPRARCPRCAWTARAAADAVGWDRQDLECELGTPPVPRAVNG